MEVRRLAEDDADFMESLRHTAGMSWDFSSQQIEEGVYQRNRRVYHSNVDKVTYQFGGWSQSNPYTAPLVKRAVRLTTLAAGLSAHMVLKRLVSYGSFQDQGLCEALCAIVKPSSSEAMRPPGPFKLLVAREEALMKGNQPIYHLLREAAYCVPGLHSYRTGTEVPEERASPECRGPAAAPWESVVADYEKAEPVEVKKEAADNAKKAANKGYNPLEGPLRIAGDLEGVRCRRCADSIGRMGHRGHDCPIINEPANWCRYPLCASRALHTTTACPTLHALCCSCQRRGHWVSRCGEWSSYELFDLFIQFADLGHMTVGSEVGALWHHFVPFGWLLGVEDCMEKRLSVEAIRGCKKQP